MIKNHLLITLRILRKNILYSSINVLGLAIGMAALLIIGSYVWFENSYDSHSPIRSFRVLAKNLNTGELNAGLFPTLAPAMQEYMSGIDNTLRIFNQSGTVQPLDKPGRTAFSESYYLYADSSFFTFFPWQYTADQHPLATPYGVAISQGLAEKYFGNQEALGQTVKLVDMFGDQDYTVTAVYDLPENTQLPVSLVFSNTLLFHPKNSGNHIETWGAFTTYALLNESTSRKELEEGSSNFLNTVAQENLQTSLVLQPTEEVYMSGEDFPFHHGVYGTPSLVKLLGFVGLAILFLAWINYINLATARALDRAREVGIRKTLGSVRVQLVGQFLLEAFLLNGLAALLAVTLAQIALPFLEAWVGIDFASSASWRTMPIVVLTLVMVGTLASGGYPAIVLSGFSPTAVLKGILRGGNQNMGLRKVLVVTQFIASVTLLGATFTIYRQVEFMRQYDLGVNIDRNLVVKAPRLNMEGSNTRLETFRSQLVSLSFVESLTVSNGIPGTGYNYGSQVFRPEDVQREHPTPIQVTRIDEQFTDHFELPILAGVGYLNGTEVDYDHIIVNEATVTAMGYEKPEDIIGLMVHLNFSQDPVEVIGVVANYHHESLRSELQNIAFQYTPYGSQYALKLAQGTYSPNEMQETLSQVSSMYQEAFPENPFVYSFLNDEFDRMYREDQRFGQFFGGFSLLAVIIGCLGLLGLATYMAAQRTKEVGIRKVLGASGHQIFVLLSKELVRLVSLSTILAIPLLIYFNERWLSEFPFRSSTSLWVYILPALIITCIAWGTVSYKTWQSARENPTKALRSE